MKKIFLVLGASFILVSANVQARPDKAGQLPPGLQKKAQRGQPLPPGWQNKLAKGNTLDQQVYEQGKIIVPIDDKGIITLRVEDRVVRLVKATREIVDILH
ncbi:MAG: hypothetical protein PVJ63_01870 [Thioalkalispiraceae bacterium]|jgi:hypothetical protein